MTFLSIGDMAQSFLSRQRNASLKSQLAIKSQELTTGVRVDLGAHLGQQGTELIALDYDQIALMSFSRNVDQLDRDLEASQLNLEQIGQVLQTFSSDVIVETNTGSDGRLERLAERAKESFGQIAGTLNAAQNGRMVFSGTSPEPPLDSANDILSALRAAVLPATDLDTLATDTEAWFSDPVAGFSEHVAVVGKRSVLTAQNRSIDVPVTASDNEFSQTLAVLAKVILASEAGIGPSEEASFLVNAASETRRSGEGIVQLQAKTGASQQQTQDARANLAARKNTMDLHRSNLTSADPYETAARFQEIERQLEASFTMTARMSRLNLMDYLR